MTLSITAIAPSLPAQAATLADVLTPGTVVDARVLKLLDANLVRLAIASLTLDVATEIPLQPGQALQFAVTQNAAGISLSILDASAKPDAAKAAVQIESGIDQAATLPRVNSAPTGTAAALSPEQTQAVQTVVREAATRQNSLAPLFANLDAAVAAGKLPAQLQPVAAQVLSLRPRLDPDLTGQDIKSAFQASGLFPEASASAGPDLKAALIVLRQTLATFLTSPAARESVSIAIPLESGGDVASPEIADASAVTALPARQTTAVRVVTTQIAAALPGDDAIVTAATAHASVSPPALRAASAPGVVDLLRAYAQSPELTANDLPSDTLLGLLQLASKAQPGHQASTDHAVTPTPPPPFRGALPSLQPIAAPSLAPDATPVATAAQLLDDTDSAIARQTLLQVASLPDRADIANPRLDTTQPRWAFEIPFATPQGTAVAQFEISRDGSHDNEASATSRVWRARFSLDVEPAGPVHALISLNGEITSVRLWAERPATAAQLRSNAGQLGEALGRAEIIAGDIVVQQGAPAAAKTARAGHFLDRAT